MTGCTPQGDGSATESPATQSKSASWESGDSREVWSRCGPVAGTAEECLTLARRHADGTQSNTPACIAEIGGPGDQQLNNAWLTLGPNGADPVAFEQLRARRLTRFQSALAVANDPVVDLKTTQRQIFRDEFTDCWNTYGALRGLTASPEARDGFLDMMDQFHNP